MGQDTKEDDNPDKKHASHPRAECTAALVGWWLFLLVGASCGVPSSTMARDVMSTYENPT